MSPIAKKLLLKPGLRGAVLNPPEGYLTALEPLPEGASLVATGEPNLDFVQVFARDAKQLAASAPAFGAVKTGGLLWVCYLKGGKKAGTDLNRDILWEAMAKYNLTGVTLVSIDAQWSAMRFRPEAEVGK